MGDARRCRELPLGSLVLAACGSDSDSATTSTQAGTPASGTDDVTRGGTLTFARSLDAEAGLNPINAPNNGSIFTIQQIFDQLVEVEGSEIVPGPGGVVGALQGRPRVDVPPARRAVLQRRPGDRRGRQVLDRALRRPEDQRQLRDARLGDRVGRRGRRPHGEDQPEQRRRRLPRQPRDVRGGDRAAEGRRGGRRQGLRREPGRLGPVHGHRVQARPADGARAQPPLLARGRSHISTRSTSSSSPTPTRARSSCARARSTSPTGFPYNQVDSLEATDGSPSRSPTRSSGTRSSSTPRRRRSTRSRCARRWPTRRPRTRSSTRSCSATRRSPTARSRGSSTGTSRSRPYPYDIDKATGAARQVERAGRLRSRAPDPLGRRGREADGRDHQGGSGRRSAST